MHVSCSTAPGASALQQPAQPRSPSNAAPFSLLPGTWTTQQQQLGVRASSACTAAQDPTAADCRCHAGIVDMVRLRHELELAGRQAGRSTSLLTAHAPCSPPPRSSSDPGSATTRSDAGLQQGSSLSLVESSMAAWLQWSCMEKCCQAGEQQETLLLKSVAAATQLGTA